MDSAGLGPVGYGKWSLTQTSVKCCFGFVKCNRKSIQLTAGRFITQYQSRFFNVKAPPTHNISNKFWGWPWSPFLGFFSDGYLFLLQQISKT